MILKLEKIMMLWDQILQLILINKPEIHHFMETINGIRNRIKSIHNIAITTGIKMEMNTSNTVIKVMKKAFLMIFSTKKTIGMNKWSNSRKIIKNIISIIQTSKKTNKKNMKMHGNNICINSKKNSENIMKNRKGCMNKWMIKITHSLKNTIIHNMLHVGSSEYLYLHLRSWYFGEYYFQKERREKENFMSICRGKERWKYLQGCRLSLKCMEANLLILGIHKIHTHFKISSINNLINSILLTEDLLLEQFYLSD